MFEDLYNSVKLRFGNASATDSMGDWINLNTTLKKRPFTFEHYEFQKAIADDMHPDMSVIKCSQVGLALDLDTPIPTPNGWSTMGELKVGDFVYDEQGQPTRIEYVSPVFEDRKCYRVTFDDGESIVADADHRWYVECDRAFDLSGNYSGRGRPPLDAEMFQSGILKTEVLAKYHQHGDRNRFAVPNTKVLQAPDRELPVDPYFLGTWLGDGNTHACVLTAHNDDAPFVQEKLVANGMRCLPSSNQGNTQQFRVHFPDQVARPGRGVPNSVSNRLQELSLLGASKFIPPQYLRSSPEQRRELLRGLLDTDGSITKGGRISFYNTNPKLIEGVNELARSLGYKTRTRWKMNSPSTLKSGHVITPRLPIAEVSFVAYAEDPLFMLPRKQSRQRKQTTGRASEVLRRRITKVTQVPTIPVRCISVDSPNHLFLAGKGMIPTHNTEVQIRKFLALLARGNAISGIFSLPNEKMATKTYNGRIKTVLDSDAIFNPATGSSPVRRRDQIQIRDSFGYITGCTDGDATSTSADFLMHDEVDLSPQDVLSLYQSRLQNSDMQITQRFSTPTFLGYGIDSFAKLTDQREYVVRCSSCNHYQIPRFTHDFIHFDRARFEVESFYDLNPEQIGLFDFDEIYVKCEQCHRPLDLGNPATREWVATYPTRLNARGYHVRPFSTSRLKPRYLFTQLAKNLEAGTPRHFANTVLGEPFTDANAEIQRADVEKCMQGAGIPDIPDSTPVYMGIDVGFTCYITLHIENDAGLPEYVLFEACPHAHLETRVGELRRIYTIIQGAIDRFPFEPSASGLRDITNNLIMPVQWRGTAGLNPQKDELGNITHYSANQSLLFDNIHSQITQGKLVLRGYTHHRETLIGHLCDMIRIEQPDAETEWKKRTGADHFFHSMGFSKAARRISDHMYQSQQNHRPSAGSAMILGLGMSERNLNGLNLNGAHTISRLG
jgi:hypothetical protein